MRVRNGLCHSPRPPVFLRQGSPGATGKMAQHKMITCVQHWPLAEMTDDGQQLPLTSITPAQVGGISQNRPRWPGLHVQTPALHTPCGGHAHYSLVRDPRAIQACLCLPACLGFADLVRTACVWQDERALLAGVGELLHIRIDALAQNKC